MIVEKSFKMTDVKIRVDKMIVQKMTPDIWTMNKMTVDYYR
jgi:hypothetical protein